MQRICLLIPFLLFAPPLEAQVKSAHALVAIRAQGSVATQLLEVDLMTGSSIPLGRFLSDCFPPLAVVIDPVSLDVIVAVDLGGTSRFLRLEMSGSNFVSERLLADVPGTATHLSLGPKGEFVATFAGADGKLIRLSRSGGPPVTLASMPHSTAMTDYGFVTEFAIVVQSLAGSEPLVTTVELNTGQVIHPTTGVTGVGFPVVTGVFDMPTAVPRQLLTREDGTVVLYMPFTGIDPAPLQISPPLPPGGAVAMRGTLEFRPIVLGGSAHPFLQSFDLFGPAPLQWTVLAGPFPGDPVDYFVAPEGFGVVNNFGLGCGKTPTMRLWGNSAGTPQLGNQDFKLMLLDAAPSTEALLALGFDDQIGLGSVPLPFKLPSGCDLLISPDHVLYHVTTPLGQAEQILSIPNQASLLGLIVYAQWFQMLGLPFSTSDAAAIRVGT